MNINLARKLDINFGIPACFILTLFDRIKKPFIKTSKYAILPKRILFLGISELGSAILSYPAIKIAHENYPRAELFFCIFKEKSEAVKMLGLIREENIFTLRSDNFWFLFIDSVKSIVWMRSRNIDTIIAFYAEVLLRARRKRYKIKEVQVMHSPRLKGRQTGANIKVMLKAALDLIRLKLCFADGQKNISCP